MKRTSCVYLHLPLNGLVNMWLDPLARRMLHETQLLREFAGREEVDARLREFLPDDYRQHLIVRDYLLDFHWTPTVAIGFRECRDPASRRADGGTGSTANTEPLGSSGASRQIAGLCDASIISKCTASEFLDAERSA